LLNTRSRQGQGQGQDDRVKSIFRSNDCKPPTGVVMLQMWVSFDIRIMISQQSQIRVAAKSPMFIGDEWSRRHSDYLADHSGIQILNWIQLFRLFYRDAAGNDRI